MRPLALSRRWWSTLALVQLAALVLVAVGQHWLVVLTVGAASLLVLAATTDRLGAAMIALVPLTQPVLFGGRAAPVIIYPEYLVIPFVFVMVSLNAVRDGGFRFRRTRLVMPLVLFLIVAAVSVVMAAVGRGWSQAFGGLPTLVVHIFAVMFFVGILEWLDGRNSMRQIFLWMFNASVVVSLFGILEYFFIEVPAGHMVRIGSTLGVVFSETQRGNPNALAAYLAMVALMALALVSSFRTSLRIWIGTGVVAHVVALLLTQSRSGLVALLVGGVWLLMRGRRQLLWWLMPATAVGLAVAAQVPRLFDRYLSILSIVSSRDLIEFFLRVDPKTIDWTYAGYFGAGGFSIDALAGANRFAAWALGATTFLQHPWTGIGLQMNFVATGFSTAENYFLDIAVMTGIGGLLAVIWWGMRAWRLLRSADRIELGGPEQAFLQGCEAMLLAVLIIAMTGSVLFSLKIMLTLLTFMAMAWHVIHMNLRWQESSP